MRKIYIVNININGGNIVENNMAIEYPMFCYQCEQTAGGKGCTKMGVCGKTPEVCCTSRPTYIPNKGNKLLCKRNS